MKKRTVTYFTYLVLVFLFGITIGIAQDSTSQDSTSAVSINIGSDLVSRYVWRGLPFDESFCIQPTMSVSAYNFSFGTWGSYSLVREVMDECDLYLSYIIPTSSGNITAYLYDYHNPNIGGKFLNFKGNGEGSHMLELYLQYDGPQNFPLTFLFGYNIHNDPDNSKYVELGYKHTFNEVDLSIFFGATKGISDWYQVEKDKFVFINTGINASKKLKITNDFSPTMTLSYILNPYLEKSYLIFKLSI